MSGKAALGVSLLLVGCSDPKSAAYQEALACWASSAELPVLMTDGSTSREGLPPTKVEQATRAWASRVEKAGQAVGKSSNQVVSEMNVALRQVTAKTATLMKQGQNDLAQKSAVSDFKDCMERL